VVNVLWRMMYYRQYAGAAERRRTTSGALPITAIIAGILTTASIPAIPAEPSSKVNEGLNWLQDSYFSTIVTRCRDSTGEVYIFAMVIPPENTGGLTEYYQFALFSHEGRYDLKANPLLEDRVTDADQRNGIDARFRVTVQAKSRRSYRSDRGWNDWYGSSTGVIFGQYELMRRNGEWEVKGIGGGSPLRNSGRAASTWRAPSCEEIPR
jgi:hypothetical protein